MTRPNVDHSRTGDDFAALARGEVDHVALYCVRDVLRPAPGDEGRNAPSLVPFRDAVAEVARRIRAGRYVTITDLDGRRWAAGVSMSGRAFLRCYAPEVRGSLVSAGAMREQDGIEPTGEAS